MSRRFRAIAIAVALAAIAFTVFSHRHHSRSSAPRACPICRHGLGGREKRAIVIASPKVIGKPLLAGDHVDVFIRSRMATDSLAVGLVRLGRNMRVLAVNGRTVTLEATRRRAAKLIYVMQLTKMRHANARLVLRRELAPGPLTLRV